MVAHAPTRKAFLMIIDNGPYGSTGDQPTYADKRNVREAISAACGLESFVTVTPAGFRTRPLTARR